MTTLDELRAIARHMTKSITEDHTTGLPRAIALVIKIAEDGRVPVQKTILYLRELAAKHGLDTGD